MRNKRLPHKLVQPLTYLVQKYPKTSDTNKVKFHAFFYAQDSWLSVCFLDSKGKENTN